LVALRMLGENGDARSTEAWKSIVAGVGEAVLVGTLAGAAAEESLVAILARSARTFSPAAAALVAHAAVRTGAAAGMEALVALFSAEDAPKFEVVTAI